MKNQFSLIESAIDRFFKSEIDMPKMIAMLTARLNGLEFIDSSNNPYHKIFTISLVENSKFEQSFAIRVFPSLDNAISICTDLVDIDNGEKPYEQCKHFWCDSTKWVIEIDVDIFDRSIINFTPQELTALFAYNIGYTIYGNDVYDSFWRAVKESSKDLSIMNRATNGILAAVYAIPLAIACCLPRWDDENTGVMTYLTPDDSLASLGYLDSHISAVTKLERFFSIRSTQYDIFYNKIATSCDWAKKNIVDVVKRKSNMKDDLYYTGIQYNSLYIKSLVIHILNFLGYRLRERYSGAVVESMNPSDISKETLTTHELVLDKIANNKLTYAIESMNRNIETELANESATLFNSRKKVKVVLPSQYEVDAISIEIDKITNHHDRIYVLDLIYALLERVNHFEEVVIKDPMLYQKWAHKINSMRSELDMYRVAVLSKKNLDKSYKFFVKYPAGYEG